MDCSIVDIPTLSIRSFLRGCIYNKTVRRISICLHKFSSQQLTVFKETKLQFLSCIGQFDRILLHFCYFFTKERFCYFLLSFWVENVVWGFQMNFYHRSSRTWTVVNTPLINNLVSTASNNGSSIRNSSAASEAAPRLPGIGGLFGEGFPKLKPTTGNNMSK
jgi:hypothetical protein